jgi:hypothetical protein
VTKTALAFLTAIHAAGTIVSVIVAGVFVTGRINAATIPVLNRSILAANPYCWGIIVAGFFFATVLFVYLYLEHPAINRHKN